MKLQRIWSETTADAEAARQPGLCATGVRPLYAADPGLHVKLTYDPDETYPRSRCPRSSILDPQSRARPKSPSCASRRERQWKWPPRSTAPDLPQSTHMSDIISGRVKLADFRASPPAAVFYGDVLGAGEGWAKSILFNPSARRIRGLLPAQRYFCIGRVQWLPDDEQPARNHSGAENWAHFSRNQSEQFEARFVMVEVQKSPSIFSTHGRQQDADCGVAR